MAYYKQNPCDENCSRALIWAQFALSQYRAAWAWPAGQKVPRAHFSKKI